MAKKRTAPPSRVTYERLNPTVSARLSLDLHNALREMKEKSGKSVADILKVAIGAQAPSVKRAHDRGYLEGWENAETRYRVNLSCSVCGGTLPVEHDNVKLAIRECMRKHQSWHHGKCRGS